MVKETLFHPSLQWSNPRPTAERLKGFGHLLASKGWKRILSGAKQQTLVIVQPETLLRGPRELFRLVWKLKSKAPAHQPKVATETVALIREMAKDNRLWSAEQRAPLRPAEMEFSDDTRGVLRLEVKVV